MKEFLLLEYSHPKMRDYIHELVGTAEEILRENRILKKEVDRLTEQVQIFEARLLQTPKRGKLTLVKDSHNSNQPPSQDKFKKPPRTRSQREFTGRKPGGQKGHPGQTLDPVPNPDIVRRHALSCCPDCKQSLVDVVATGIEKRDHYSILFSQRFKWLNIRSKRRTAHEVHP